MVGLHLTLTNACRRQSVSLQLCSLASRCMFPSKQLGPSIAPLGLLPAACTREVQACRLLPHLKHELPEVHITPSCSAPRASCPASPREGPLRRKSVSVGFLDDAAKNCSSPVLLCLWLISISARSASSSIPQQASCALLLLSSSPARSCSIHAHDGFLQVLAPVSRDFLVVRSQVPNLTLLAVRGASTVGKGSHCHTLPS